MNCDFDYATYLDEDGIADIRNLEGETGKRIMAYHGRPEAATLPSDQIKKLQELEKKLCVRLVAYETH